MRKFVHIFFLFCLLGPGVFAQETQEYPKEVRWLMQSYPSFITGYAHNCVLFSDSSSLVFNDGKKKTYEEKLKDPDIKDIFADSYLRGKLTAPLRKNQDPGRIRNEDLLKKMYGQTQAEVEKSLIEITWCPGLLGQKIKVTTINRVHEQFQKVSAELDKHPEWKEYLRTAGTYNRRLIRGTHRLSTHSFGIAIDLNVKYSDYWQWGCGCTSENTDLTYTNRIPQGIVDIFEKYGFIWGGKWYHYDTMHFEYRPELLVEDKSVGLQNN